MCMNVQLFWISEGTLNGSNVKDFAIVLLNSPRYDFAAPSPLVAYVDSSATPDEVTFTKHFLAEKALYPSEAILKRKLKVERLASSISVEVDGVLKYRIRPSKHLKPAKEVSSYLYEWLRSPEQWESDVVDVRFGDRRSVYSHTNALVATF